MAAVVATPSPRSPMGLHTPPAPKHGYSDKWEPYSPRKSARIASQTHNKSRRTPSPEGRTGRTSIRHQPHLTPPSKTHATIPSTPATSPRKRNHQLYTHDTTAAREMADDKDGKKHAGRGDRSVIGHAGGMLPTPTKTPAKRLASGSKLNYHGIARNILDDADELTPSRKKRRTAALTDDAIGFFADEGNASFQIHVDSQNRIPEPDNTRERIFSGPQTRARHPTSDMNSQARKVMIPGEGLVTVAEALERTDGMVATFRGKRIFRKFSTHDPEDGDASHSRSGSPTRARTRSQVPKLLFPPTESDENDPEEAETEIEDADEDEAEMEPQTPSAPAKHLQTPKAPRFGPVSPPTTERVTRFRHAGDKGSKTPKARIPNPLDGWRRSKSTDEASRSTKA